MSEQNIGVPGAMAAALRNLGERIPPERLDRIWVFPPMTDGRKESAVIAAACFADGDRRTLVTLAYRAEETGRGVSFESSFQEEGVAPKDRLSRVMEGAVERSGLGVGGPRSTELGGDPGVLEAMILEWTPSEGSLSVTASGGTRGVAPRLRG